MKSEFLIAALLITVFFSCKNGAALKEEASCNLSGKFINQSMLDRAPGSFGKKQDETNYFALELTFNVKDSVDVDNGFEKFRLPYLPSEEKCKYKLLKATQLGDMILEATNDSMLVLIDTAWTNSGSPSIFKRARLEDQQTWNYENHLNNAVLAGTYTYINEEGKTRPVRFLPNGQVNGLKPYLSYALCFAGDCLGETQPPATTIEFTNDTNQKELFAIEVTDAGEIRFFKVADPVQDIKGERAIGELAFVIKKQTE